MNGFYIMISIICIVVSVLLIWYNYYKDMLVYEIEFDLTERLFINEKYIDMPFTKVHKSLKLYGRTKEKVLHKFDKITQCEYFKIEITSMILLGKMSKYRSD